MNTDKHRLGNNRGQESRNGKEKGRSKKRMLLHFFLIHLHLESECSLFGTIFGESEQQESVQQEGLKWDLIIH